MLKTYVIHYSKLPERRGEIEKQIKAAKLDVCSEVEYVVDYDRERLDEKTLGFFYEEDEKQFRRKTKGLWNISDCPYRILTLAECSCAIKHLMALKAIAQGEEEVGLILEDDAIFDDRLVSKVTELTTWQKEEWDACFLGTGCGDNFQRSRLFESKPLSFDLFEIPHPATNCTEAYLIKKETAKKIYGNCRPFHLPMDFELGYQFAALGSKVTWLYPSVVSQGSKTGKYNSSIEEERQK